MKLPDFTRAPYFLKLFQEMDAKLVAWDHEISWKDPEFAVLNTRGIELKFEDLQFEADGSFTSKYGPVVVYIRDQPFMSSNTYRFHLAWCGTLETMQQNGRYDRYVQTTNTTGKFIVNECEGRHVIYANKEKELRVCMRCLSKLNYKDFRDVSKKEQDKLHRSFNLDDFLKTQRTRFRVMPQQSEFTSPLDIYPDEFDAISLKARSGVNWICQGCYRDFSTQEHRKYLHAHHLNGHKGDNRDENLKVLCVRCHAEEPQHGRLKSSPQYATLNAIYWTLPSKRPAW